MERLLHNSKNIFVTIWSSLSLPFFFGRIIFERMGFLLLLKPWFDRPHCIQKRRKRRSEFAAVPTVKKKRCGGQTGKLHLPRSSLLAGGGGKGACGLFFFRFFHPHCSFLPPPSTSIARRKIHGNIRTWYSFLFCKPGLRAIHFYKMPLLKKDTSFPGHV